MEGNWASETIGMWRWPVAWTQCSSWRARSWGRPLNRGRIVASSEISLGGQIMRITLAEALTSPCDCSHVPECFAEWAFLCMELASRAGCCMPVVAPPSPYLFSLNFLFPPVPPCLFSHTIFLFILILHSPTRRLSSKKVAR